MYVPPHALYQLRLEGKAKDTEDLGLQGVMI